MATSTATETPTATASADPQLRRRLLLPRRQLLPRQLRWLHRQLPKLRQRRPRRPQLRRRLLLPRDSYCHLNSDCYIDSYRNSDSDGHADRLHNFDGDFYCIGNSYCHSYLHRDFDGNTYFHRDLDRLGYFNCDSDRYCDADHYCVADRVARLRQSCYRSDADEESSDHQKHRGGQLAHCLKRVVIRSGGIFAKWHRFLRRDPNHSCTQNEMHIGSVILAQRSFPS